AVIPARLASTRLPNKPLADIGGKPMGGGGGAGA
ncbi:cytidylyltransferase domain-containing protein, partial [Ralstonia solanacearum]